MAAGAAKNAKFRIEKIKEKNRLEEQRNALVGDLDVPIFEPQRNIESIQIDRQEPASNVQKSETQTQIQQNNEQVTTGTASVNGANNTLNTLHDYAPYNYIITLSCISKNQFNEGQEGDGVVIAKSAGKGTTGEPPLDKDFYIDNLMIRNAISPTLATGTGTTVQVLFEVTEPYGVSFIDALIQAADIQGFTNHLQAVY